MKNEKNSISRRKFIKQSSVGLAAVSGLSVLSPKIEERNNSESILEAKDKSTSVDSLTHKLYKPKMAQRILGKTGMSVSLLAFGGGSQFMKNDEDEWQPLMERAVEVGINFFDTSRDYSGGDSEVRFGKVLNQYRDKIYVCTKLDARESDESKQQFEGCLSRLKMDCVDVLLIHALKRKDKLSVIENGVYNEMVKFKNEGTVKFIGFSVMEEEDMPAARSLIENLDIDVVLGVINPMKRFGNCSGLLPIIAEKNIGFLAMKTVRGMVRGNTTAKELITYALEQRGVSSAVIGHHGIDKLEENIKIVKEYASQTKVRYNWKELEKRLEKFAETHTPVWALPGYHDGMMV